MMSHDSDGNGGRELRSWRFSPKKSILLCVEILFKRSCQLQIFFVWCVFFFLWFHVYSFPIFLNGIPLWLRITRSVSFLVSLDLGISICQDLVLKVY